MSPPSQPMRAITDEAKQERREAIIAAALNEFYEKGLAAARLEDVAERAGVSKGTLYLYFSSKEDLFRELVAHYTSAAMERLDQAVSFAPNIKQALQNFAMIGTHIIRESQMPNLVKVMIGESQVFPEIMKSHRERIIDKTYALLAKLLSEAEARGEIEIGDPDLTARLVFAPVVYSGVWQSVFAPTAPKALNYQALLETHVDLLLKGMNYQGPPEVEPSS